MSATYQITSLATLKTSTVSLDELSRSLKLNSIVSCDDQPLGLVTHWDLVFFARTWAGWALDAAQKKPPEEVLVALSLVDQWLQDPGSVSREELSAAARSAAGAAAYQRQGKFIIEHLKNSSQTSFPFPRA